MSSSAASLTNSVLVCILALSRNRQSLFIPLASYFSFRCFTNYKKLCHLKYPFFFPAKWNLGCSELMDPATE